MVNDLGKIIDDSTVRFERVLPAPIERVWQYLTSSECLPEWLAEGNIDQRFGGKVKLKFDVEAVPERAGKGEVIEGSVTFIDPLRALAYSWGTPGSDSVTNVSMQVSTIGDQASLVLTHSQLPAEAMAEVMAGWHAHLDVLKARLASVAPPDFRKRFKEVSTNICRHCCHNNCRFDSGYSVCFSIFTEFRHVRNFENREVARCREVRCDCARCGRFEETNRGIEARHLTGSRKCAQQFGAKT